MPSKRSVFYWICQVMGWGLNAAVGVAFIVGFSPRSRPIMLAYSGSAPIGVLCTHLYRGFVRKRGWLQLSALQALWRAAAGSVVIGVAITMLLAAFYYAVLPASLFDTTFTWVFPALYVWISTSFVWNMIYFGVHYFERSRAAEVEQLRLAVVAKDAELRALLAQVNPHFMFNCLNSVRALVVEDPARAQNMITDLANLLRYTLQSGRRMTVPLAEELEAVSAYLKLEGIRFEERLRVELDTDPATLRVPVPTMLIQTLVENGITHGVGSPGTELEFAL